MAAMSRRWSGRAALAILSLTAAGFSMAAQQPRAPVVAPSRDRQSGTQSPAPSVAGGTDFGAFTFTRYELEVKITPQQQQLEVRGEVTLRNDSAQSQQVAQLQISSTLKWASIKLQSSANEDAEPLQFSAATIDSDIDHTGKLNVATVALAQPVAPSHDITLEVGYAGTIPLSTQRLQRIGTPAAIAAHNDWDHIGSSFSGVRGAGSVAWYPVAIAPATLLEGNKVFAGLNEWKARESQAVMHVRFVVENAEAAAKLVLLANGDRQKSSSSSATAGVEYTFEPLGLRVPTFVIGAYKTIDTGAALVRFLGTHSDAASGYGKVVDKLMPLVGEWFGQQREKLQIIELEDRNAPPFESGPMFFAPLVAANDSELEVSLIHPLTHSFFYSSRPWIYEGVAHFAQALQREQQGGREAALASMQLRRPALALAEPEPDTSGKTAQEQSLLQASDEIYYRTKAMFVWWMLRDMMGDEALQRALKAYAANPAQDTEASTMQKLLEKESKKNLEWFFDDWVYRDRGLPDFRVASVFTRPILGGVLLVTGNLENMGSAGAEVPVTVETNGRPATSRILVKGHGTAVVRIEAQATPLRIKLNDGSVPESDVTNNSAAIVVPAR